ncbi:MAG: fibronectin type III domain-containing protein, partial [bacterium]
MIISAKKTAVFTVMVLLFSVFAGKSAVFAALADETSGGDNDVSSVRDAAVWGLNASVENEEIILKWEPSGKMDMVYDIYRSTQPDGEYLKINKEPIRENLYSDNPENSIIEPVGGVVYYYRVEGVLEGASAGESEIVSAEKPEGRLVPPSDFEAQAVFMNVNLNWSAPRSTGENSVEGYHIYRSETQGEAGERINSEIIKGYEYRDASGQEGTEYFYSIQSEDAEGNVSEISRQVSAVPFEKTSVPADIQMEQLSNESIYLTWAEPEGGTFGI